MILTRDLIKSGMTANIGINKKQCEILGLYYDKPFKLKGGWMNSIIGKEVSSETYDEFVEAGKSKRITPVKDYYNISIEKSDFFRMYKAFVSLAAGRINLTEIQTFAVENMIAKMDKVVLRQ